MIADNYVTKGVMEGTTEGRTAFMRLVKCNYKFYMGIQLIVKTNRHMNILYITQWFGASGGGGEVVFSNLANGMTKRGHAVDVICAHTPNLGEISDKSVTIHRVNPVLQTPPPSLTQNVTYILNATKKGYHVIKLKNIDLIHANNLASSLAGSILSKITGKPLVVTIHDIFSTSSPGHWKNWVAQDKKISRVTSLVAPLLEKVTVKTPSAVIHTVSKASKNDLIKFGANPSKIRIIPNGLDAKKYLCSSNQIEYKDYILFIGRLVFYKNLDVVIASFTNVVRKLPSSKLVVVGDGPMMVKWQKMVSDLGLNKSIIFAGRISENEKNLLLSKCSALVLPSFVEGFGLVILESFAMQKPVLVANIEPLSEIIDDGIDGFVLPFDNPIKWSEKISHLLLNKEICIRMGQEGRKKLEKKYDSEYILDDMESLYLSLLKVI